MAEYLKNWAGQEITVGDIVWRGARDGNTSSFKIGQVVALNAEKNTAKVRWFAEPGVKWVDGKLIDIIVTKNSTGSPSINTLALIDEMDLAEEIRDSILY